MDLKGKVKKLQNALLNKGVLTKIETTQFYSEDQKRMITMYHLKQKQDKYSKSKGWQQYWEEIIKTASIPEVIFCLVDMYKAVIEWQKKS